MCVLKIKKKKCNCVCYTTVHRVCVHIFIHLSTVVYEERSKHQFFIPEMAPLYVVVQARPLTDLCHFQCQAACKNFQCFCPIWSRYLPFMDGMNASIHSEFDAVQEEYIYVVGYLLSVASILTIWTYPSSSGSAYKNMSSFVWPESYLLSFSVTNVKITPSTPHFFTKIHREVCTNF